MASSGPDSPWQSDHGDFAARIERNGAVAVVIVAGDVDMSTAPALAETVATAMSESADAVVVDLTDVRLLSSSGLAVLVAANGQAASRAPVRIVAGGRATTRVLQMTGLDQTLAVYPSRAAALAAD